MKLPRGHKLLAPSEQVRFAHVCRVVQVLAITGGVLKMEDGIAGFGSIHDMEKKTKHPFYGGMLKV